jgi:hypothetical protein
MMVDQDHIIHWVSLPPCFPSGAGGGGWPAATTSTLFWGHGVRSAPVNLR